MHEGNIRPFEDLVMQVTDRALTAKDASKPYVGLEHIPSSGTSLRSLGNAGDSISTNGVFAAGDILFGKLRPRLRKSVRVDQAGYCSTDVLVLRARPGIDAAYAGYIAQSDEVFRRAIQTEEGTKMPRCSWGDVRTTRVFFPATQVHQQRIAAILTSLDNAIEATEALIEKHQQIKAGLMQDLFTRGVLPTGVARPEPASEPDLYHSLGGRIVPKSWREAELQDIAQVGRGKFTHRPRNDPRFLGGAFPFIQTGDIAAAAGDYLDTYSQTLSASGAAVSSCFPTGTIAVTIAANIADTAILSIPMYFPDSVVGVVVTGAADVRFVELSIRRSKPRLEAMAPQSAQKNINLQDLRPLKLMLPPLEEQQAISARYEAAHRPIKALRNGLAKLRAQKLGLMQDLLTGKVPVTVPEPALPA